MAPQGGDARATNDPVPLDPSRQYEQAARDLFSALDTPWDDTARDGWRDMVRLENALFTAITVEREACARIVQNKIIRFFFERSPDEIRRVIASAIRQRAEATPEGSATP